MADAQNRLGQQMGEYHLLRLLGKGAFGAVYLAEHVHDGSRVAVKLLQIHLNHSEDFKAFLNEARTIRLRHPHIVPLLDFGLSHEEQPFLVMEYAPGGTLRNSHAKGSRLPLPTILRYVQQMASALQYAHEHRVIHRDVKPENMLVRADGTLLLSDFGIATVAHSSHSVDLQQGIGGTLPYMAPEQIQGKPRPSSDQYALGVVVYEWIAGQRPFQGTAVEIAMQHAMTTPPSLLGLIPTLPIEVEQVVFKALAKEPKERFTSIELFAQALQAAIQPSSVPSIPFLLIPLSQRSTPQPTVVNMQVETISVAKQDQPNELSTGPQQHTAVQVSPARSEWTIRSAFTGPFALPPLSTSPRRQQIIRDILALLCIPFLWVCGLDLLTYLGSTFNSTFSGWPPLLLVIPVFLIPYLSGIGAAILSKRKGFAVLIPVLLGCIGGFACLYVLFFFHLL